MIISIQDFGGSPVVLAFARAWNASAESTEEIDAIRAELRGLGATLVVLSRSGIWSFRPDDDFERFAASNAETETEIARLAALYDVPRACDGALAPTVIVLDGAGKTRFANTPKGASQSMDTTLAQALGAAGRALASRASSKVLLTRRELILASLVAGFTLAILDGCTDPPRPPPTPADAAPGTGEIDVVLHVNGSDRTVRIDPRVSLLDALRERMGLTGSKKGCDHGQCGACTVLVEGRRVCSCLMLAIMARGKAVTTIEGLSLGDALHPMQAAFASQDGLQCGYCTPGQIMSAVGLLAEGHAETDDEVREGMSGNICRCGAYPNIISAVQLARKGV